MQPTTTINPDVICQQAVQAKLNVYQAKEQFEAVLKTYNDRVDNLMHLVGLMKDRVLELEEQLEAAGASESAPEESLQKDKE